MAGGYRSFTAFWLGGAGDLSAEQPQHVYGRQGIWYGQSQSGIDYPLTSPSEDVRYLLADLYLSYTDPADYADVDAFIPPFSVYWLYGFGDDAADVVLPDDENSSNSSSSSSMSRSSSSSAILNLPSPTHTRDIIIHDAVGNVVFDSTLPDTEFETKNWTAWLAITRWSAANGDQCSVVHYTAWAENTSPEYRSYPEYFFPEDAVLQEMTAYRLPKRVRSVTTLLSTMTEKSLTLGGGYNMQLTLEVDTPVSGGRLVSGIRFDATPGGGDGVYPDCTPGPVDIRTINGISPTPTGQFFLNAVGCYYARQPVRILTEIPRTLLPEVQVYPGATVETDLPDDAAGTTTSAAGWPLDITYAHLQLGNDCGACCDCDDYIAVAEYIQLQHARYKSTGNLLANTRDTYHSNRLRWNATKACLQQVPVRIVVQSQRCPYVDIGVQVCNQTNACMVDISVVVMITTTPGGGTAVVQPGFTFITQPVVVDSIQRVVTQRGAIASEAHTFSTVIGQLHPAGSAIVRFRLGVDNCGQPEPGVGYQINASATAYVKGIPLNASPVTGTDVLNCPPLVTIPAEQCIIC